MLNVIDMFREQNTRDELGIASIRDAYSDYFFPGTTTIQTRAKYMLFVPWIYQKIELKYTDPGKIAEKAGSAEIQLINCLKNNNQTDGLIGLLSGAALQRLPSSIYWYGLLEWGIRLFPGSIYEYHRFIPAYRRKVHELRAYNEGEGEILEPNWHPGIPAAPDDFPEGASFDLKPEESEYLRERITAIQKDSLLACLVSFDEVIDVPRLWEHPAVRNAPAPLSEEINRSRCFAEIVHGAALLYNYMLAEKKGDEEGMVKFKERIESWAESIDARSTVIKTWAADLENLWGTGPLRHRRIHPFTRNFIEAWTEAVTGSDRYKNLTGNREARELLLKRELTLKKGRARLSSPRALELWSGDSGSGMLDYRWYTVKKLAADIVSGAAGGEAADA